MTPMNWFRQLNRPLRRMLAAGFVVIGILCGVSALIVVWGELRRPFPEEGSSWLAASMALDLGREQTVPAWWSSVLWLLLGLAAVLLTVVSPKQRRLWVLVAVVATYASVDEYAELHERWDAIGNVILEPLPWHLAYAWVLPGIVVAIVVAVLGLRLARTGAWHLRWGLIYAATLFIAGAVVLEIVGSLLLQYHGRITWHFAAAYHIEEVLEMVAITVALVTLLALLDVQRRDVRTLVVSGPANPELANPESNGRAGPAPDIET